MPSRSESNKINLDDFKGTSDGTYADGYILASGMYLTKQQALYLEDELKIDEFKLEARLLLLGFYHANGSEKDLDSKRHSHTLWMIRNVPHLEIVASAQLLRSYSHSEYSDETFACWEEQIALNGDNTDVLGNAAFFYYIFDDLKVRELYVRANAIDPSNPRWKKRIREIDKKHT